MAEMKAHFVLLSQVSMKSPEGMSWFLYGILWHLRSKQQAIVEFRDVLNLLKATTEHFKSQKITNSCL